MNFIFTEPAYLLSQEVPSDLRSSFNLWLQDEMPKKFGIVSYSVVSQWFHDNNIVPQTADPVAELPYNEELLQLDFLTTCCRPSRVWFQGRFSEVTVDYDLVEGFSGHIDSPILWQQKPADLDTNTIIAQKAIMFKVLGYFQ